MSFQAMAWASEQTTGSHTRKIVLYALANHVNHETGVCTLSVERICRETELRQTAVKNALVALAEGGFIDRLRKRRTNGHMGCYEFRLVGMPETRGGPRPETRGVSKPETRGVSHEPSRPSEPKDLSADAEKVTARKRNLVWDCLVEVTGFTPTTASETTDFGKTVSELRAVIPEDATKDQILAAMVARKRAWDRTYDGARLTHRVLRSKWGELGAMCAVEPPGVRRLPELPEGETF